MWALLDATKRQLFTQLVKIILYCVEKISILFSFEFKTERNYENREIDRDSMLLTSIKFLEQLFAPWNI